MGLSWSLKRLLASPLADLAVWAAWLLLVTASLLLPLYLAIALLSARDCTPHHSLSLPPGLLSSIDPAQLLNPPPPSQTPGLTKQKVLQTCLVCLFVCLYTTVLFCLLFIFFSFFVC